MADKPISREEYEYYKAEVQKVIADLGREVDRLKSELAALRSQIQSRR